MGMPKEAMGGGYFAAIKQIADRLDSPNADKIYVAKDYTKADLRRDLLATIPQPVPIAWEEFTRKVTLPCGTEVCVREEDVASAVASGAIA